MAIQQPRRDHSPIVWLDAIHYKVKEDGHCISKTIYMLLGLNMEGRKEILGLYLSENEGASYWLNVFTKMNNLRVKDILIACVDGLGVFPETETLLCIIQQIRNPMKYVASKNQATFMANLKPIYRASTKEAAELASDEKWTIPIHNWSLCLSQLTIYFKGRLNSVLDI